MKPVHKALFWMQLFTLSILFELGGFVTSGATSTAYRAGSVFMLACAGILLAHIIYTHLKLRLEVLPT
jgi:hypothetical protein